MALLGKSLQSTHSHSGFKSFFNIRTVFFCCSRSETEPKNDEEVVVNNNQIKKEDLEEVEEKTVEPKLDTLNALTDPVEVETAQDTSVDQDHLQPEHQSENSYRDDRQATESCSENQKSEQLNYNENEDHQTLDDNTYSPTDEFDNISEHELNVAVSGTKIDRIKCGDVRIKIGLDSEKLTLIMTVLLAHDYARPSSSTSSIREHSISNVPPVLAYSIHVLVVQVKKHRYKTKMRQGPDPFFNEIIKIPKINQEETKKWCLRFRLYGSFRNAMTQVIGEGFLPLEKIDIDKKMQCDILLMTQDPGIPHNEMNTLIKATYCKCDSVTSLVSTEKNSLFLESGSMPELFVGLAFNCNTGRLTVFIRRGTNLPKLKDNKLPDTFIKLILSISKGEETAKTPVIKSSNNPTFDEIFSFQVCGFQLDDSILTIQGYQMLKFKKKFMFGSFSLGSKVGEEEREHHWKDLLLSKTGEEIKRWHTFDMHT